MTIQRKIKYQGEEYIGKVYGRLTVLSYGDRDRSGQRLANCVCDCGNKVTVPFTRLERTTNHVRSCGCLSKDVLDTYRVKHDLSKTRLYNIFSGMKGRCYNKKLKSYKNYGGRGITICDAWLRDFKTFYDWANDNGYADDLTIDRIDVEGNYEPSNCRWLPLSEQQNNKTDNLNITYKGKTQTLMQWSKELGINYNTLRNRLHRSKYSIEDAFEKPVQGGK